MAERKSWEVEVRVKNIEDFADEVRAAGQHLLAFIGDGEPKPCFLCGEFECECLAPTPEEEKG